MELTGVSISNLPNGHIPAKKLTLVPNAPHLDNTRDLAIKIKKELLYKVLHKGNIVRTRYLGKEFTFRVGTLDHISFTSLSDQLQELSLADDKYAFCEVTLETDVEILEENASSDQDQEPIPIIGGLDKVLTDIFDLIHGATTKDVPQGWIHKPSRGIILYGPSGCGKTLICNYLSRCTDLKHFKFVHINASSIFSKYLGESEVALQKNFQQAYKNHPQPTIIILEDIHILCKKNDNSDLNRRMISAVLNCMDNLSSSLVGSKSVVIATSPQIEDLDGSLLRSGRFDCSIEVPIPTPDARYDILHKIISGMPNQLTNEETKEIANVTHGFLGADLVSLVSKAVLLCPSEDQSISIADVNNALTFIKPSAMREILIEVPTVHWTDIGGQHDLKLKLQQSVDWPLRNPEVFKRFGIKPPKGVLMYGPPGCSKTMIAKALATESKLNFLSIKGPELFSMWVGESERAVRELFRKARSVAPAIIFFDEIDAIGGERSQGGGGGGSSVNERVLAQLLTEMDGVTSLDNVTIVAATNRPDMIDKALLRPGRIDRVIHVRLPDAETRREIFRIKLKSMPIAEDVDIERLVELTEGYSGAEIQAICQEAALKTLEESLDAQCVHWQHVLIALTVVKPRTSKDLLELYEKYEAQFEESK